jgi:RNA polymerase sigma-70 factor (ECF subfamily)
MSAPAPVDHGAFGRLVAEHQRRLFALVLMMVRDPAGAEDVAQEAFVRAYRHFGRYDARLPFYPWLATIAVRLAQNWLRGRGRVARREGTALDEAPVPPAAGDALAGLLAGERDRRLWRAVAALPSGERTAVYMHYRQDMKVAEVASALGVTTGTVKTLLFRARRKLRQTVAREVTA